MEQNSDVENSIILQHTSPQPSEVRGAFNGVLPTRERNELQT